MLLYFTLNRSLEPWNDRPDLTFVSDGNDSCLRPRKVLKKFSRSQHRPSLISAPKFVKPAQSEPFRKWNFCKTDCKHYSFLTNVFTNNLPSSETTIFTNDLPSSEKQFLLWLYDGLNLSNKG